MVNKTRLNEAFKALRKHGLIARQNYLCCGTCAGYKIACDAENLVDKGKAVAGAVFYHKQAGDRLREGKGFYVNFGTLDTQKHGTIGTMTDEEIGRLVVREFEAARLKVTWNGNTNQAILVEPGEPEPKTSWERLAG
jgi:hypothetical protein